MNSNLPLNKTLTDERRKEGEAQLTIEEEGLGHVMLLEGPVDGEEASICPTLAQPASIPCQWGPPQHNGVAPNVHCVLHTQG